MHRDITRALRNLSDRLLYIINRGLRKSKYANLTYGLNDKGDILFNGFSYPKDDQTPELLDDKPGFYACS